MPKLEIGPDGWCRYLDDRPSPSVWVQFGLAGDRLEVKAVHVSASTAVTGTTLRALPLAQIEVLANSRAQAELIRTSLETSGGDAFPDVETWWREWTRTQLTASGGIVQPAPSVGGFGRVINPAVERPSTRKLPDEFYEQVARVYTEFASICRNPAGRIAEANKVESTTVHRWLKEARRRGIFVPRVRRQGSSIE